ncbi:hypothetical protein SUGI_0524580 [Cryptomeria japonica]|nr:hypothetical protein SUGI_0524580 [Cryptomeria japonica]
MSLMWLVLVVCFLHLCAGQDLQTQYLSAHNNARSQVGFGPLVWDDTVATYAQNYANQRMADCAMQHSNGQYGENLFWGRGMEYTPADAVSLWVNEKINYDYNSNSCAQGKVCGHYTQVVWRNSQKLGCARVKCNNGAIFITCNYDPRGNYIGMKPY